MQAYCVGRRAKREMKKAKSINESGIGELKIYHATNPEERVHSLDTCRGG